MKTLHLVLKGKWYDMIAVGEKREEYREMKRYWVKRLLCQPLFGCGIRQACREVREGIVRCGRFANVCFHRGYTSVTMTFEIESMSYGRGKPEWGAPDYDVFIIRLGERV